MRAFSQEDSPLCVRGVWSEECGVRLHSVVRDYTRWCEIILGGARLYSVVRGRGGTGVRDYSGGGLSALRVISSPPESGGEPDRAGWSALGFAACYQRDARTRRNETLSVCLFKGSVLRRKGRKKSQKFFVLRTLQSHTDHTDLTDFLLSRRN